MIHGGDSDNVSKMQEGKDQDKKKEENKTFQTRLRLNHDVDTFGHLASADVPKSTAALEHLCWQQKPANCGVGELARAGF